MEKRYQVFISSTYSDLKDERSKVMKSIMDLDCIPAGMEMFPAIDEDQFEFIKKIIDDCDYYILIIGGRYGSMTESGISYTEMEFDYAMSKRIPVLAFLHNNIEIIPSGKVDMESNVRAKLDQFKEKVKKGRLVKFWDTPGNLTSQVIISLAQTMKAYPAVGWVRANFQTNAESLQELNELRKEVERLREFKRDNEKSVKFPNVDIADWDEEFSVNITPQSPVSTRKFRPITMSWEEWFKKIAVQIKKRENEFTSNSIEIITEVIRSLNPRRYANITPLWEDVETIGNQFVCLEVIKVVGFMGVSNWHLTPTGENIFAQMMCIKTKKKR